MKNESRKGAQAQGNGTDEVQGREVADELRLGGCNPDEQEPPEGWFPYEELDEDPCEFLPEKRQNPEKKARAFLYLLAATVLVLAVHVVIGLIMNAFK